MIYVAVCDFSISSAFQAQWVEEAFIFVRAIFSTRHAQHVIAGTFLLLLLSSSYWSCPV